MRSTLKDVGVRYRLRVSVEGPDADGLFTARAEGASGDAVATGRTREEASTKAVNALGGVIPNGLTQMLAAQATRATSFAQRPTGVRRYWQNLARGWVPIGGMMCAYGAVDRSALAVAGSLSLILWGAALLVNLGGAADAIAVGGVRRTRFVNGVRRGSGAITVRALLGIALGSVATGLFIHAHYY